MESTEEDSYSLSFTSGGKVIPHLNKISNDGHYSIVFFNNHITVYSINSRLAIRSFYDLGINDIEFTDIIDTFVSPINNNLIYILSKNSKTCKNIITIINWFDNIKNPIISNVELKFQDNKFDAIQILNFNSNNETLLNLLVKSNRKNYSIITYNLNENKFLKIFKTIENVNNFTISNNSKNIAFLIKKKTPVFKIFSFDDNNSNELNYFTVNYQNTKFTPINLAISNDQTNPLLAFGTSNGSIILLFDLLNQLTNRILKWHIGQPKTLKFNNDSTYLLSGGIEKVLVFWNILNEKQQFLPRLNGKIENILINSNSPSLISLSLNVIDNDLEYLILGTTDLLSKLNISTPHLFSGMNNDNLIKKNLTKDLKLFEKSNNNFTKFKHPFKLDFKINPNNNNLYLKSGRHLQIFNYLQNLQINNIAIAPAIQQYGKVGSEIKIQDPMVIGIEFINCSKTNKKDWIITCDVEIRGEIENLSNDGIEYWETLKFWKNSNSKTNETEDNWVLQTKILRPHGNYPITNISPAPKSYFGGEAVLTSDLCGNIRLWRPNSQGIWSLRKFYSSGSENLTDHENNSKNNKKKELINIENKEGTICCWSPDSSLIAVGKEGKIILLDVNTFQPIHSIKPSILTSKFHTHFKNELNDEANNEKTNLDDYNSTRYIDLTLQDKHINSINFTSNGKFLIIETRSHLTIVDVLKNKTILGLILSGEKLTGFGGSIIKVVSRNNNNNNSNNNNNDLNDDTTDELLIISKFFNKEKKISSKISLWNISDKKATITCKYCKIIDNFIIGAEWSESWQQWILADINSRFGELGFGKSYSKKMIMKENEKKENDNWIISSLLDNARIVNKAANNSIKNKHDIKKSEDNEEFNDRKGLQNGVFDGILDHLEGVSMDTLFDRVLKVV